MLPSLVRNLGFSGIRFFPMGATTGRETNPPEVDYSNHEFQFARFLKDLFDLNPKEVPSNYSYITSCPDLHSLLLNTQNGGNSTVTLGSDTRFNTQNALRYINKKEPGADTFEQAIINASYEKTESLGK